MTLILGALGLWPHLEYRINARLNTGGTFQSQAVCHTTCLSACPVPKGHSQPGRLEVTWISCRAKLEVGCLNSGPTTISLGQRLSPLWPSDQTPCYPSTLTQITALASTVPTVHRDDGWRQTCPCAEMGRARNKTCAGACGWKTRPGKMENFGAFPSGYHCCPFSQACRKKPRSPPGSTGSWDSGGWRTCWGDIGWEFFV